MTNPEQEFFEFLTTEENLKGLIIAKNQFPIVREKLIQDFWNSVLTKINEKLKAYPEWEAVLEPNITKWYSKLYIKEKKATLFEKNQLPSFIFCFQRLNQHYPYVGFWINEETTEYNRETVKEYMAVQQKEHFSEFKGFEEWWLVWDEIADFDLSIDETLLQIRPDVMHEKAQDFADRLFTLFEHTQEQLIYIKKFHRTNKTTS